MANPASSTFTHYRQCKNPYPRFVTPKKKGSERLQTTLPFNKLLMEKAQGLTASVDFSYRIAGARALGLRRKAPPELRRKAIDALFQGICFHYDFMAGRVNVTLRTLAIECGLATEADSHSLAITRVTRALQAVARDTHYISYSAPEVDESLGCYMPTTVTLTPAFFEAIDVSSEAIEAHIAGRVNWLNQKRINEGNELLPRDALMDQAKNAFPDYFREVYRARKAHGEKQARARRDLERSHAEIKALVHRELTFEIAHHRFPRDLALVKAEVERRIRERMVMRRHHTRLTVPAPT